MFIKADNESSRITAKLKIVGEMNEEGEES
jgi:hypothetical protein